MRVRWQVKKNTEVIAEGESVIKKNDIVEKYELLRELVDRYLPPLETEGDYDSGESYETFYLDSDSDTYAIKLFYPRS